MKKSKAVKLGLLHGVILAGASACTPNHVAVDPCNTRTFNPPACQQAIAARGYYYQGQFFPMIYPSPYSFYYGGYNTYIAHGGRVYSAPPSAYQRNYVPTTQRAEAFASRATRNGAYLSASRTGSIASSSRSFSSARSGATFSRGGFGSTGAGRGGSFGG
jgi:hypothetical protein